MQQYGLGVSDGVAGQAHRPAAEHRDQQPACWVVTIVVSGLIKTPSFPPTAAASNWQLKEYRIVVKPRTDNPDNYYNCSVLMPLVRISAWQADAAASAPRPARPLRGMQRVTNKIHPCSLS